MPRSRSRSTARTGGPQHPAADPPGPAGPGAGLADPRSRRRRTLHPDQRALPIPELASAGAIYAYSFILTNLDVSAPDKAAAVEHWYRHRTTVENIFRDGKLGAALRHLPSGYPQANMAWMWGALLAATMAAWLHQLTAHTAGEDILAGPRRARRQGHDRHPAVAADRRPRPADPPRPPPDPAAPARPLACFPRSWPGCGTCPPPPDLRTPEPRLPVPDHGLQPRSAERPANREPGASPRAVSMPATRSPGAPRSFTGARDQLTALFAESGQRSIPGVGRAVPMSIWLPGWPALPSSASAAERAMSCLPRKRPARKMCAWSAGGSVGAGVGPGPEPRSATRARSGDSRHRSSSACPPGERRRQCPGQGSSRGFWCAAVACLIARWLLDIAPPHWLEYGRAH